MKKIMLTLALLAILFLATNFEELIIGRTEIEELYSITLAGIDKNTDDKTKEYLVTTVSPTTEEAATKPNNVMSMAGDTAFEANRLIGMYAENDIYWGHTRYILVGEEAAKEDVFKHLDFFYRDHEPRMTLTPFIVKGGKSQDLIGRLYEQNVNVSSTVDTVIKNFGLTSYSSAMRFGEVFNLFFESQDGYLPCLELEPETKLRVIEQGTEEVNKDELKKESEESQGFVVHSPGYALIKDGKVIDYLIHEQGRGLNWIINKIVSGVIIVEHEGVKYNLEIVQGNSKIEPKIDGDTLSAKIKVNVITNITEMSKHTTIDSNLVESLEIILGDIIKKEVEEVVKIAQKHEIDILGLGDKFHHRYPVKWQKKYKDQWEEEFPNLDIKVSVEKSITRSARFFGPLFIKEGK